MPKRKKWGIILEEEVSQMDKQYTIVLKRSEGQYVALCLELMVVGCGDTKEEAMATIKDAICSYLDATEEGMEATRPVPLEILHDFLKDEEEEPYIMPKMKILAYG
ncbi:MAG: hypothetical protein AB1630_11340 [bacterium]